MDADELAGVTAQAGSEVQEGGVLDEVAEGLDEGLVGDAEVLVAAPGQDRRPLEVRGAGELGGQARLSHPRLTGEQASWRSPATSVGPQCPRAASAPRRDRRRLGRSR